MCIVVFNIQSGPEDSKDIDYTSEDSFLVHWHGFIDLESGIKMYRLGVSHRCLGNNELYNFTDIADILVYREMPFYEQSVRVPANFTGKKYVTVVALNNAMEPSEAVCSDGITRDLSPPEIRKITLQRGRWAESIMCSDTDIFLLDSNLKKSNCRTQTPVNSFATLFVSDTPTHRQLAIFCRLIQKLRMARMCPIFFVINLIFIQMVRSCICQMIVYTYNGRIGSNKVFYIFIKVTNKASLGNIYTFGPELIDQTPQLNSILPNVVIENDKIMDSSKTVNQNKL